MEYPREAVERAAEGMYDADDSYPEKWDYQTEDVKDWYRGMALAAIRAFHNEGD